MGVSKSDMHPHSSFRYHNTPSTVQPVYAELRNTLEKNNIKLELFPSMEYRIIPEVWPAFCKNRGMLCPWERNHILIEFPIRGYEFFGELDPVEEIKKLICDGYKPVLAHPERYHYMGIADLDRLLNIGCKFQMNLASLHGFYDQKTTLVSTK